MSFKHNLKNKMESLKEWFDNLKYILGIRRCCYTCEHVRMTWNYECADYDWSCHYKDDYIPYNEREHHCKQFKRG